MNVQILSGDCRQTLAQIEPKSVQCCVTSPPYWGLRSYLREDHPLKHLEIGQEKTPQQFVETMLVVFGSKDNPVGVWRVLRDDGTLWLNLGDTYSNRRVGPRTGGNLHKWKNGGRRVPDEVKDSAVPRHPDVKAKELVGIPWRVALALQAAGWYLRCDIIWAKPNPTPESVTDRCTKSHEYIFLLSKSPRYYYNHEAIKEPYSENSIGRMERGIGENHKNINGAPGQSPQTMNQPRLHSKYKGQAIKDYDSHDAQNPSDTKRRVEESILNGTGANKRSVWRVTTANYPGAHFATFPPELIKPCILAGSKPGDTVLDPFGGSGTTGEVALEFGRKVILCELDDACEPMIKDRTNVTPGLHL